MEKAIAHLRSRLQDDGAATEQKATESESRATAALAPIAAAVVGDTSGNDTDVLQLRPWCQKRLEALFLRACANTYRILVGHLADYDREANLIRKRIGEFEKLHDAFMPSPVLVEGVTRPVFPKGVESITESASRVFREISSDDFRAFENTLQAQIRHQFRSLSHVCGQHGDDGRAFLALVIEQATRFLDARIPNVPASRALLLSASKPDDMEQRAAELVSAAAPPTFGPGRQGVASISVFGIPADESAGKLEAFARAHCGSAAFLTVATSDDILLVRETRNISLMSLPQVSAELSMSSSPMDRVTGTAHARTDVAWASVGAD
jgi:hypothetical protein